MSITIQRFSIRSQNLQQEIGKGHWVNALQIYLEKNHYVKPVYEEIKPKDSPLPFQIVVTARNSPHGKQTATGEPQRSKKLARADAAHQLINVFRGLEGLSHI